MSHIARRTSHVVLDLPRSGRRIAPNLYATTSPFARPERHGTGSAEEVLPELGVGEGFLVGAEQLEHRTRGHKHHLPFGPAQGHCQASRVHQELAGREQIFAVALGGPDEDDGPLPPLEPLHGIDRRDGSRASNGVDQRQDRNLLLQISSLGTVRDHDA